MTDTSGHCVGTDHGCMRGYRICLVLTRGLSPNYVWGLSPDYDSRHMLMTTLATLIPQKKDDSVAIVRCSIAC